MNVPVRYAVIFIDERNPDGVASARCPEIIIPLQRPAANKDDAQNQREACHRANQNVPIVLLLLFHVSTSPKRVTSQRD